MFNSVVIVFTIISLVLTYFNIAEYEHFILQAVFPTCAAIMTFSAAIYSVKHKNNRSLRTLMYVMMLSSVAYMSAFQDDTVIQVVHSLTAFITFNMLFYYINSRKQVLLYAISAIVIMFNEPSLNALFIAIYIIMSFIFAYRLYKLDEIEKAMVSVIVAVAFLPTVVLIEIPLLVSRTPLVDSSLAAFSMMLISTSFVFTPLIEKMLGKQIQFKKVRYYGYISMGTASIIVLAITPFLKEIRIAVLYFLLISVVLHVMLYVKEQLDFKARRFVVTSDQQLTQYLFQVIHRLSFSTSTQQLYELLFEELQMKFRAYDRIEHNNYPELQVTKQQHEFVLPINKEHIIVFPQKRLSQEDIIWLELLIVYVDNFARSLQQIEELVNKLQQQTSPWLHTLLFQMLEKEKRGIAQELHDTALQEILHLAREVDEVNPEQMREMLHEVAFELREYCENMHPPLLETHGLKSAIDKLVEKTKLRSNFIVDAKIENVTLSNPLFIYRIVQELLNNAMKHSNAKYVSIELIQASDEIYLNYTDDGVGIVLKNSESMGLRGIEQRVQALNGLIEICEQPLTITITIPIEKELA